MLSGSEQSTTHDPNRHVREYLHHYLSFKNAPQYAVLIDGPWGVGKTYLIKGLLDKYYSAAERDQERYAFVSLFGLNSVDQIDAALLASQYSVLENGAAKIAGRLVQSTLKFARMDFTRQPGELKDRLAASAYIFDDLERCELPVNTVLGYINELVEHDGCKVIIIANQREITEDEDYRRRREKLVGKTLIVQAAFDEALDHFISKVSDAGTGTFYAQNRSDIDTLYQQSQLNNLRILQQTMWDFERVYSALESRHHENSVAMSDLFRLVFAVSFELKSGRIKAEDIARRHRQIAEMARMQSGEAEASPAISMHERYPETNFDSSILSDELLIDILEKGLVDSAAVRSWLDQSPLFLPSIEEPAWRTVWHFLERKEADVKPAVDELERQFAARELTVPGEVHHVFGLRLWLARIGAIPRSTAEVAAECRSYVDDLAESGRIEPLASPHWERYRPDGYGGLGYFEGQTPEFAELFSYFQNARLMAADKQLPEAAKILMTELEQRPELFFRRICLTNSSDNIYYNIPILAHIPPEDFVSVLLGQEPAHQRLIMGSLAARYEGGDQITQELASEVPWLGEVHRKLRAVADTSTPITNYRLSLLLEHIGRILRRVEPDNDAPAQAVEIEVESTAEQPGEAEAGAAGET
jgi:hypothetical protein